MNYKSKEKKDIVFCQVYYELPQNKKVQLYKILKNGTLKDCRNTKTG